MSDQEKDLEIMILRYQLDMAERKLQMPVKPTRAEKLTLAGHGGDVKAVAFSPDGQRIVTSSRDHTAKVWAAETGEELLTLAGHGS